MARDPRSAERKDSTMEILLDELEEEAGGSKPDPDRQALRSAATVPPPPPGLGGDAPSLDQGAPHAPAVTPEPRQADHPPADDRRGRARDVIRACEAELTSDPSPRRAGRLHYEIARLYESALRDERRASAHYQQALRYAPEHIPTIRGARRTFVARGNARAAVPLFDAEARLTADASRKAGLHLAKGRLLEDVLGRRAEARSAYLTAFELDRSHPAILKALEQVHADGADWDAYDRTLERAANVFSEDARHRAALIVQRAQIAEARRGDLDGAIELYETALRLDPTAGGAIEALKRLHHQQRRFRDLIRVLEVESEHAADPHVRAMAIYRIGRIHLERLGNRDEALAAFERAASESPDDLLVLEELVPLYQAASRPDRVVEVLQSLVDLIPDNEEKVALLHRMGTVHETSLGDAQSAIDCYEAALRLSSDHVPTLQALGRLYEDLDRYEDLARLHAHEAEHADSAHRRAAAHVRAAEILEHELERPSQAADHHARALGALPGHPPAFKALVRLLSEARQWRPLVELYERAVELARRPDEAAGYLFKIGALYEDALGDPGQAAHAYSRILEQAPKDMRAIHALQRATERAGRWKEHLQALDREIGELEDPADRLPLLHRTGEVLHDRLGDWAGGVERLRQALSIDPHHAPTLGTLGRLYHASGRWEDLLEVYEKELELADSDAKRVALLERMAELCSERIGRDQAAIEYHKRILRIDPSHGHALRTVSRLLEERGDHEALRQVLQMRLDALEDPLMRARTAFKLAELLEHHLDDPARALRAYEKALEGMPGHRPSVDALARLRASMNAWKSLVEGLTQDAEASSDPFLARDALVQAGEICAHRLGDPEQAIGCYARALGIAPDDVGVLVALEQLYRRVGRYPHLAEIHATQAEVLADDGARLAALRELLRLQVHHDIGGDKDARETCEKILTLVPDDPQALTTLEELALRSDDPKQLVYVDSRLAASAEDPADRAAHHTRLGEALEDRGEPAALEAYRTALSEDPENIAATRGLSRIAKRMDDPEALAEAARREARVSQDGEAAAELLVRSARLRADRLADFDGAVADLARALELAPDHAEAATQLDRLLTSTREHERLAEVLTRAATSAQDPERRTALWKRVAELQADQLSNLAGAIGSLNRVLRTAPDDLETVRWLAALYAKDGQWNEAVNLYHRILQLNADSEALREAHLHLAEIYDDRLGESERALVSLQAVLALDPTSERALGRLADLHVREGRLGRAREAARRLVEHSRTDPDRAAALTLLAHIQRRSGLGEAAFEALRAAIVLEGPGGEAAFEYRSLAEDDARRWPAYVGSLLGHVSRRSEPGPEPYVEISRVQAEHLNDPDAAIATLQTGLQETAGDPTLRRELATRLHEAGMHHRAVEQLQRLVERDPTSSLAWRDLARVYGSMGRRREARLAIEPLVLLGAVTARERKLLDEEPPRGGQPLPGTVDSGSLRRLTRFGPADAAAGDLLAVIAPALGRIYPTDLDAFGLAARDRISSRSDHPLTHLVAVLCGALGGVDVHLYVHRVRGRGVALELGKPSALLVPAALLDAPLPHQVFLVGRPLVDAAQGFDAVDKLTPRELEVLLASAARAVEPGFGRGLTSEEFLDAQARRIHRALPRRVRKSMRQAARRYVESPRVDFNAWCDAAQRTAARVAAVLADDLNGVLEALKATERDLASLDGSELLRSSPLAHDLARFWTSEDAMALRAEIGLVPPQG